MWNDRENIEDGEQPTQRIDETGEEFNNRCRNLNPFYD